MGFTVVGNPAATVITSSPGLIALSLCSFDVRDEKAIIFADDPEFTVIKLFTFKNLAKEGTLSLRLDTHGGRYIEGLDVAGSYAVLERNIPEAIRGYRNEQERRYLIGTGVSAAAVWHLREMLDNAGFKNVKIVGSSGFGPEKCKVFSLANVPVNVIGTGSYLPNRWSETYATADIISYGGKSQVKLGREFLLRS